MERILYLALQVFPLSSLAANINLLSIEWTKRLQSFFLKQIVLKYKMRSGGIMKYTFHQCFINMWKLMMNQFF